MVLKREETIFQILFFIRYAEIRYFLLSLRLDFLVKSVWWSISDHCISLCIVYFRLLSEILKETSEDIEEIEYLTDGSWRPIRDEKERDRERERSNTPEYPVVDICMYNPLSLPLILTDLILWLCWRESFFKWLFWLQAFLRPTVIHRPTAAQAWQANLEVVQWGWQESQEELLWHREAA